MVWFLSSVFRIRLRIFGNQINVRGTVKREHTIEEKIMAKLFVPLSEKIFERYIVPTIAPSKTMDESRDNANEATPLAGEKSLSKNLLNLSF